MIRLIQWLIYGHIHEWKTVRETKITDEKGKYFVGSKYLQKCIKCGELQSRTFYN